MKQIFVDLPFPFGRFSISVNLDKDKEVENESIIKSILLEKFKVPENCLSAIKFRLFHGDLFWKAYCPLLGGKGGFGSQLRAQGGRISARKITNKESCRDLSGKRLRTINQAKRLSEFLATEPERQKEKVLRTKRKMEQILASSKVEESESKPSSSSLKKPKVSTDINALEKVEKTLEHIDDLVSEAFKKQSCKGKGKAPISAIKDNLPELSSDEEE